MRIVLADLKGLHGFVSKDTVAAGYGSRLLPFSRTTSVLCLIKSRLHDPPSVQIAYLAAIAGEAGHDVGFTRGDQVEGDVAIVLSSLVDYRQEAAWAAEMRARRACGLRRPDGVEDARAFRGSRGLRHRRRT